MNHRTNIPQDIEYFPVEQIVNLLRVIAAERDELFVALQQQQINNNVDQAAAKTIAGVAVPPAFPANDAYGFPYPAVAVTAETVDHHQQQQLHHHNQQQHQYHPPHIPAMNPHHQFQQQHQHYHQTTNNNMHNNNNNNHNQNSIHVNQGGTNNDNNNNNNNNPMAHMTVTMDNNMHQHHPTNNFDGNFGGTITNNNANASPNAMIPNQNNQNHHNLHNNATTYNRQNPNHKIDNDNNSNTAMIPSSFKVEAVKKRIAKKSYTMVKKAPHSNVKKPFTEVHEAVPNAACAMALFTGFAPKSDTSRLTRWDLDGDQVLEWFNTHTTTLTSGGTPTTTNSSKLVQKYIHPVKFDGKIFSFGGSPVAKGSTKPTVYAWAKYISLQAKYNKKGGSLQLIFRTIMVGSGRPTEAKPDSPPSLQI